MRGGHGRGNVAKRRMGPLLVFEPAEHRQLHLSLGQVVEHFDVQKLRSKPGDEAFAMAVLSGRARPDEPALGPGLNQEHG